MRVDADRTDLLFPLGRAGRATASRAGRSPHSSLFVALVSVLWERQRQKMGFAQVTTRQWEL